MCPRLARGQHTPAPPPALSGLNDPFLSGASALRLCCAARAPSGPGRFPSSEPWPCGCRRLSARAPQGLCGQILGIPSSSFPPRRLPTRSSQEGCRPHGAGWRRAGPAVYRPCPRSLPSLVLLLQEQAWPGPLLGRAPPTPPPVPLACDVTALGPRPGDAEDEESPWPLGPPHSHLGLQLHCRQGGPWAHGLVQTAGSRWVLNVKPNLRFCDKSSV